MPIEKPSAEELSRWDAELQKEGWGMYRGYNSKKLVYGEKYLQAPSDALMQDTVVWIRQKRKEQNDKIEVRCVVCGDTFLGRADSKCCPRPKGCRERLHRTSRRNRIMSVINKLWRDR